MPRYFCFGLWRVQMYEWYWGHTIAQIQLIDIDQPLTAYKRRDPNNGLKPGDKGYKPDPKKLESALRRWEKRKAEREKRGIRLDAFLRTGEKIPIDNTTDKT